MKRVTAAYKQFDEAVKSGASYSDLSKHAVKVAEAWDKDWTPRRERKLLKAIRKP